MLQGIRDDFYLEGLSCLGLLVKELKECVTQVACQVCLGSTSPGLLHFLKKLGFVPQSLCRMLSAQMAHQCSGWAQYKIRAGSAALVCRVSCSSLHLLYGCQASRRCALGSSAGLQASWGVLWACWWGCIRSGLVG